MTAHEVFQWMKANPSQVDAEVVQLFNRLVREEFAALHPNYDPNIHYEAW